MDLHLNLNHFNHQLHNQCNFFYFLFAELAKYDGCSTSARLYSCPMRQTEVGSNIYGFQFLSRAGKRREAM